MKQTQTIPKNRKPVAKDARSADNNGRKGDGLMLLHIPKLSIKESAEMLHIGETKMREMVKDGEIPVIMIHGKYLLLERDLENYLRGHYGAIKEAKKNIIGLPPLPKRIANSELLKK